jgi:nitrite reductase/ring-hydroxylating ferredoxin subunit
MSRCAAIVPANRGAARRVREITEAPPRVDGPAGRSLGCLRFARRWRGGNVEDPVDTPPTRTEAAPRTHRDAPGAGGSVHRRERVREVGPSGNHWYAVELAERVRRGQVVEVVFWGTSIAVFRGADGELRAVENRCAHRQLRLSEGRVEGNDLTCTYHGWKYDGGGTCVHISHELGRGRTELPRICIRSFPVRERYGFVWLFPGDAGLAAAVPLPTIVELEGAKPWPFEPIDVTIRAHFSMIVENVCDFNHEYLHRHLRPFSRPSLREWQRTGDRIDLRYSTQVGGTVIGRFTEGGGRGLDDMSLWYDYPYQGSNTQGKYLHHLFMLPIDAQTTRCFFVFLFGPIELPGTGRHIPELLRRPILKLANALYIRPLLGQDKWALEEEQRAHRVHAGMPSFELNPIIPEFQRLTIEKWDAYVASERARVAPGGGGSARARLLDLGAGLTRADLQPEAVAEVERVTLGVLP